MLPEPTGTHPLGQWCTYLGPLFSKVITSLESFLQASIKILQECFILHRIGFHQRLLLLAPDLRDAQPSGAAEGPSMTSALPPGSAARTWVLSGGGVRAHGVSDGQMVRDDAAMATPTQESTASEHWVRWAAGAPRTLCPCMSAPGQLPSRHDLQEAGRTRCKTSTCTDLPTKRRRRERASCP